MTHGTSKLRLPSAVGPEWYEVEVEGCFNPGWSDWLDGWEITPLDNGITRLSGWIIDQPALHGLFARLRDLNLKIVALKNCDHSMIDRTFNVQRLPRD